MKAEEFLIKKGDADFRLSESGEYISDIMKEFAELKCKELLEILAKKADEAHIGGWDLDRDEVLNAVNLKEFIK
jgi:hypothetical protein